MLVPSRASDRWVHSPALIILAIAALALSACASSGKASDAATQTPGAVAISTNDTGGTVLTVSAPAKWTVRPNTPQQATSIAFASATRGYLCAQNADSRKPAPGLFKTSDGGHAWTHVATPNAGLPCQIFLDPGDANDLLIQQIVSTPTGTGDPLQAALWRSRDGGASWNQAALIPHTNGFARLSFIGSNLFAQVRPDYFGATGCGPGTPPPQGSTPSSVIYASYDGGGSWNPFGASLTSQNLLVDQLASDGQTIYVETRPVASSCEAMFGPVTWQRLNSNQTWSPIAAPAARDSSLSFWPAAKGGMYALDVYDTSAGGQTIIAVSLNGSKWTTLPALTAPQGLTYVGLDDAAITPSGHVYAEIATSSAVAYSYPGAITYALDATQPTPAWSIYAANVAANWSPVQAGSGLTMWSIYTDGQVSAVASLAMP